MKSTCDINFHNLSHRSVFSLLEILMEDVLVSLFSGGWLLIAYIHGDSDGTSEMNCVDNVDSFYTASLFSIETQHTIGKIMVHSHRTSVLTLALSLGWATLICTCAIHTKLQQ